MDRSFGLEISGLRICRNNEVNEEELIELLQKFEQAAYKHNQRVGLNSFIKYQ